jgi:hypothetical protein
MKHLSLMPLLLSPIFFSTVVNAETKEEDISPAFTERFKLGVGGYLVAKHDAAIIASTPYLVGGRIDLQDDLGMDNQTNSFRVDGFYRFTPKHKLEFSYYQLNGDSRKEIDQSFNFNGSTYAAGTEVDSYLNLDILKLTYMYSFYHNEKVELSIGGGLHFSGIDAGIHGEASKNGEPVTFTQEDVSLIAPLPVFGFRVGYAITPQLSVSSSWQYFALDTSSYSGTLTDLMVTAEYRFYEHWSIGGGLNSTKLMVTNDEDDEYLELDHNVLGFIVYMSYSF